MDGAVRIRTGTDVTRLVGLVVWLDLDPQLINLIGEVVYPLVQVANEHKSNYRNQCRYGNADDCH